jgi:uncharacterized membrane protein
MLTWIVVIALAIGVYGQRIAGALLVDAERLAPRWRRVLDALPLAIISAVIATISDDGELTLDARLAGVGVAVLCASRKLPMFITVVAAAATTATIRAVS